jgi:hypothetical protein
MVGTMIDTYLTWRTAIKPWQRSQDFTMIRQVGGPRIDARSLSSSIALGRGRINQKLANVPGNDHRF